MKSLEVLILVLISVFSTTIQDTSITPVPQKNVLINNENITMDTTDISSFIPESHPSVKPRTTSKSKTITTVTTSVPTTPPVNNTTSVTMSSTTVITSTTSLPTRKTANVTTSLTTVNPVDPTTSIPDQHRRFDGPSFVGGIVLALGLVAIGFVAFKFYKARTELNYHTL